MVAVACDYGTAIYLTSYRTVHTAKYNSDSHYCCTQTLKSNLYFNTALASRLLVQKPMAWICRMSWVVKR
jgi:hypothetical protein